nr:protein farnesyltransferase subunit beta isoform X1 [Caretta caretta]
MSGRQPPLAVLLDPAQFGAVRRAHPRVCGFGVRELPHWKSDAATGSDLRGNETKLLWHFRMNSSLGLLHRLRWTRTWEERGPFCFIPILRWFQVSSVTASVPGLSEGMGTRWPWPLQRKSSVCQFLSRCQSPSGGFGGGPGQHPHLAPTYAAVSALCIIGTEEAFNVVNREKLLEYLYSLKQPDGSFIMHVGGEVDVRSTYCAASVASLTNIITPTLFAGTAAWIARCQNWEGGIGGVPGMEAHGGYTFCGLAALVILKQEDSLNLKCLLHWVTSRQMRFEGGFQGRCNKLVDGCYSFWQAGLLPLLHRALHAKGDPALSMTHWMFDQQALQEYILLCCQCPAGGLLDKPGKSRDFYHTCYCLSGLSIAQHFGSGDLLHEVVLGVPENRLQPTHPVYNISPDRVVQAVMHFLRQPIPGMPAAEEMTAPAGD